MALANLRMSRHTRRMISTAAMLATAAWSCFGRQPDVTVVKPGEIKITLSLAALSASGHAATAFKRVLENDLWRSGWFRIATTGEGTVLVAGRAAGEAGLTGQIEVTQAASGKRYLAKSITARADEVDRAAHALADEIVWAVKGVRGIASTRIAMIRSSGGKKDVYICDADGRNFKRVTRDGAICLRPSWFPDGTRFVYTSYHGGYPDVYLVDLSAGTRRRIVDFPGVNSGAAVSPDGKSLALTLSKDGNPDLYLVGLADGRPTRLTFTRHGSEANPSWSPDGNRIVYVSNTSGAPHLYLIDRSRALPKRLTYLGSENVCPSWGPDGRIAYSSRRAGLYQICITDPGRNDEKQLTTGDASYEEPSWAPDGRHIACTRTIAYRSRVYILDTLGDPPLRLTPDDDADWYCPAWSQR